MTYISLSVHFPIAPEKSYTARIPNTKRNNKVIRMTLNRAGIAVSNELTTTFIPSFLDTTLSGLNALRALNPLKKDTLTDPRLSNIQFRTEKETITKSRIFQESLRYVPGPITNPKTNIFINASAIKIPEITLI